LPLVPPLGAGFFGRQIALKIPGLDGVTEYEVETMYKGIKQQLAMAGLEPEPSLSKMEVVTAILKENNKHSGLPFKVRMTRPMAASITEFHDVLRTMQSTSPEAFDDFLNSLRAAGKE